MILLICYLIHHLCTSFSTPPCLLLPSYQLVHLQLGGVIGACLIVTYLLSALFLGDFTIPCASPPSQVERLSLRVERESPPPPPMMMPPPRHDAIEANMVLLQIEREREERIARILKMEKELTYLRAQRDDPEIARELAFDKPSPEERYAAPDLSQEHHSYRDQSYPMSRADERRAAYFERHGGRPSSPPYAEHAQQKEKVSYPVQYSAHRQHEASPSSASYKDMTQFYRQRSSHSYPSARAGVGGATGGYGGSMRGRAAMGRPSLPVGPGGRHPSWQSPTEKAANYKPYSPSGTYWN